MYNYNQIPNIRPDQLSGEARHFAEMICKDDVGTVRRSKPALKSDEHREAAYIWRMVVFQISSVPQHQCLPVCADWDLPKYSQDRDADRYARKIRAEQLDAIVDQIVNTVPLDQWHGIRRWGEALGMLR